MKRKFIFGFCYFFFAFSISLFGQGFTDVSASSGTAFNHDGLPTNQDMQFGTGAAWLDYNQDGHMDFYVTNRKTANKLYSNNGDGTFTEVAGTLGVQDTNGDGAGVVIGDINNDGYPDLYLANGNEDAFYKNNAGASFTDITSSSGVNITGDSRGTSASFGDYDEDGFIDLYVSYHWHIPGSNNANTQDYLFYNNGDETFTDVSDLFDPVALSDAGFIAGWTDYDHDNDLDIILVNDCPFGPLPNNGTRVFRNDGGTDPINDWTFTDVSSSVLPDCSHGMGIGIGDFNRDGWMDIVYSNVGPARLFKNNSGVFEDVSSSAGIDLQPADHFSWGNSFLDYDNDGWQDIVLAVGSFGTFQGQEDKPNFLFKNNGDDTFTDEAFAMGVDDSLRTRNIVHADYDRDGDLDLLMINYDSLVTLYRNDINNSNNYLRVFLKGTISCKDALGAKVKVTTPDGVIQHFEMKSGTNLGGGDELCAHFGIGSNTSVTQVEVTWLTGTKKIVSNVAMNSDITIIESAVVPIELIRFSSGVIGKEVELNWSTATEIGNDYFEIQWSSDGVDFESIGKVKGAGDALDIHNYSFLDKNPIIGKNYYRLKQVDVEGSFSYSPIEVSSLKRNLGSINIYPNPVSGNSFFIQFSDELQSMPTIKLYDLNGQLVLQKEVHSFGETSEIELSTEGLDIGVYQVLLITETEVIMQKLMLIH